MNDKLFRLGPAQNRLPYGVTFDAESNCSTILDRLFRPIVSLPGKWPRCDLSLATPDNGPPLYGAKLLHRFFGEFAQPGVDPIVRRRIRALVNGCAALRTELRRRNDEIDAADEPPPLTVRTHADLVRHTFHEAAA